MSAVAWVSVLICALSAQLIVVLIRLNRVTTQIEHSCNAEHECLS